MINAQSQNNNEDGLTTTSVVVKSTYFGSRASTSSKNPCKGATDRICAIIETKLDAITEEATQVTESIFDENKELVSKSSYILDLPFEDAKKKIASESLGGVVITVEEDPE